MKMNNSKLINYIKHIPKAYEASSSAFWDDSHISKYMLKAHLDPEFEGASRKISTIQNSVKWITEYCGNHTNKELLDLGCGPGIYAELLTDQGFTVTGIDYSKRSVNYAKKHAEETNRSIQYHYKNYLNIDYEDQFDIITLIYCDFGVLSPQNRTLLLKKAWEALKKQGILILDVFTAKHLENFKENQTIEYQPTGFWSAEPHIVIQRNILYPDTSNTLEQYLIVKEEDCACYNMWNQIYTPDLLTAELKTAGFPQPKLFDDITGPPYTGQSTTLCITAQKV